MSKRKRKSVSMDDGGDDDDDESNHKRKFDNVTVLKIGVDGGATSTDCSIINKENQVISRFQTGSTNINSVGNDKAYDNLKKCIMGAIERIEIQGKYEIVSVGLAMSSCDRPEDTIRVTNWVNKILKVKDEKVKVFVTNDACAALCSGTLGKIEGIVLISGTGVICLGYIDKNTRWRSGGWGPLFLDKGSGFWIGQQVLLKIGEHFDGFGKQTKLTEYTLKELKLKKVQELIPYVYNNQEWERIAALAKFAFKLYYEDDVSKMIIDTSVNFLHTYIKCIIKKMKEKRNNNQKFVLVLSGSILTHENSIIAKLLSEKVMKENSDIINSVIFPKVEPAVGAALMV